ncbi:MAG: T9SS type A sorting domain-containing protein [Ignavibacteriaceae bacterium]|nr:T9SS type A sorting domain-containing protein [Ignavibacteriaceae bacterium]
MLSKKTNFDIILNSRHSVCKALQIFFLFLLLTQSTFSQWYQQNSGHTDKLLDVHFKDSNCGYAVGENGVILNTTNGGVNWWGVLALAPVTFRGVSFSNTLNGFVVGNRLNGSSWEGWIYHTSTGGGSWFSSIAPGYQFYSVCNIDGNNIFIVGDQGVIFKSTSGGNAWYNPSSGTTNSLEDVALSDVNHGTIVGQMGTILHTTDGGYTWITQSSGTFNRLSSVCFVNADYGFAVGDYGTILRTTNGGTSWTTQTSGTSEWLLGVSFTDLNNGTVVGSNGKILRTTNGGTTWVKQTSGTSDWLFGVSFSDTYYGTAVGANGIILRTTNGGVTFIEGENVFSNQYDFTLDQNFPNPFNPTTTIGFGIPASPNPSEGGAFVTLKVYDILGNEVKTLTNKEMEAGYHTLEFDASELPSGVYFYQLKADSFIETRKMVLLR